MDVTALDQVDVAALFDRAFAEAELETGIPLEQVVVRHPTATVVSCIVVKEGNRKPPRWTAREDAFLRENLGELTLEEIGRHLGRSNNACKIRLTRQGFDAPSKREGYLTGHQAARILGVDIHNIMNLTAKKILPAGQVAGRRGILRIRKITLYRWAINPMNWIYFFPQISEPDRIGDPHLRRLIVRQKERWNDEWWTPGQVAVYYGVDHTDVNRLIQQGKIKSVKWGNHRILRSEALKPGLVFYKGKGSVPGGQNWTEEADLFLIRARSKGRIFRDIARMMKMPEKRVDYRFRCLVKSGEVERLKQKYGI